MATTSPPALQEFLSHATFPAAKSDLMEMARSEQLAPTAITAIEGLPDRSYADEADVSLAIEEVKPAKRRTSSPSARTRKPVGVMTESTSAAPAKADDPTDRIRMRTMELRDRAVSVSKEQLESRRSFIADELAKLSESMRTTSDDFRTKEDAVLADLSTTAADALQQGSSFLRSNDIDTLTARLDGAVKRQPALVIGGAFLLGLAAMRFLRAGSAFGQGQTSEETE